jgi:ABC-type multidrug transport system permease subunit
VLHQVTLMTFREFIRTPEALFWTYGFPLVMALSLGLAFRSSTPSPLQIAVVESDRVAASLEALRGNPRLAPQLVSRAAATAGFEHGKFLLVLDATAAGAHIELDPTRPESELARLHVERALQQRHHPEGRLAVATKEVTAPGSRYIDWLIPGLIGLNLLGAGLWGVGFNMVQMRVKCILRRLMVTPMRRSEFLLGFLLSRLVLVLPESAAILAFGAFVFGTPVTGSLLTILLLILFGAVAFTGLGMLIASRAQTIETVSGLMNLTMLPMWILGGSFFSSDRFPELMQPLVMLLPLTHLNNGLRAVIADGASVFGIAGELAFLGGFAVVAMALAIRLFRWT